MALSDRLLQARKRRALSLREVAARVGVSHTQIANYEKGHDRPDSSMLVRLADALETPVSTLLRAPRVGEIAPSYRRRAGVSKRATDQVVETIRDVAERYAEIEAILDLHDEAFTCPDGFPMPVRTPADAERAANALRTAWTLGTDPIENVVATLEERGVWVVDIEAHNAFDGCAFWAETPACRPVVAVRLHDLPGDRIRLTVAHELGHLVLSIPPLPGEDDAAHHKRTEALCYRFGGAFLAPAEPFRQLVGASRTSFTEAELVAFKERLGLSIRALVRRCRDLAIVSDTQYRNACIQMNAAWGGKQEPGVVAAEAPLRFTALVRRAYTEGLIARTRAEQLLNRPLDDAEEEAQ